MPVTARRQPAARSPVLSPPTAAAVPPCPQNPFGAAKPREAVIAEKLGKTEEEVLKEEVTKEKLHVSAGQPPFVLAAPSAIRGGALSSRPGMACMQAPAGCAVASALLFAGSASCLAAASSSAGRISAAAALHPCCWHCRPTAHTRPDLPPSSPLQLRLSGAQLEEKRQAETEIKEVGAALGRPTGRRCREARLAGSVRAGMAARRMLGRLAQCRAAAGP